MMDQKEGKPSSPKVTVATTTSPQLPPSLESEVFESSNDNAISEMKKAADMGPDKTSSVFSHEEKQQLDSSSTSINDTIKKVDPGATSPAMVAPTLQEREENNSMKSIEENDDDDIVSRYDDAEPDFANVDNASEEHGRLDKSVTVYNSGNKGSYSNLSNYDIYNPYITGIKFWQAHSVKIIDSYNQFLKAWIDGIKLSQISYENI
jgi:hypothetical protein